MSIRFSHNEFCVRVFSFSSVVCCMQLRCCLGFCHILAAFESDLLHTYGFFILLATSTVPSHNSRCHHPRMPPPHPGMPQPGMPPTWSGLGYIQPASYLRCSASFILYPVYWISINQSNMLYTYRVQIVLYTFSNYIRIPSTLCYAIGVSSPV